MFVFGVVGGAALAVGCLVERGVVLVVAAKVVSSTESSRSVRTLS